MAADFTGWEFGVVRRFFRPKYRSNEDNDSSFKSGESKELFPGISARYLPTGHIVYQLANNNNLFAVPFDLRSKRWQANVFR